MTEERMENEEFESNVGEFLKQTRLQKKLSIEEVSEALCIRKIYISAIEENNYEELSPMPYGIAFVRSYAKYLDLNDERIVKLYKKGSLCEDHNIEGLLMQNTTAYPNKIYIISGIVAAFIIYFAYATYSVISAGNDMVKNVSDAKQEITEVVNTQIPEDVENLINKLQTESENSTETNTEKSMKETTDNEESSTDEQQISSEENTSKELVAEENIKDENTNNEVSHGLTESRVIVKTKGETWLDVRDENEVYISKIVNAGFTFEVPNKSGLIFSVGRYHNVDVFIDGKLTEVATKRRQTQISLDKFLNKNNH